MKAFALRLVILAALAPLASLDAAPPAAATLAYSIDLNRRGDDLFHVTLRVSGLSAKNAVYQFAATAPGTYQVMNIGRYVKSFEAFDAKGVRVPADIGRRYGEVSGDRNPIHLHTLTAKMFGYPRAIAHGMWTKARCLAAFEGRLPDAFTVDVRFKTPVLLPSTVGFAATPDGGGWRFELFGARNGKPHVEGFVGPPG